MHLFIYLKKKKHFKDVSFVLCARDKMVSWKRDKPMFFWSLESTGENGNQILIQIIYDYNLR